MRIVVMGSGGTGGYFGAKLARAGEDVVFVARGEHLRAIQAEGLSIRSASEGDWTVRAPAVERLDGLPLADLVLFCVKSFDTESAGRALVPALGHDTGVLSIQNGVDNEEKLERIVGKGRVMGGIAQVFASIAAPGVIQHSLLGNIQFGEMDGRESPRARAFLEACGRAAIPCELSRDVLRTLWQKYVFLVAHAGMTALTRCPAGVVRALPETRRLFRLQLEEMAALARLAGADLGPAIVDTYTATLNALGKNTYSSLHYDLIHGKRLELESLHGHAVRLGERYGLPMPAVFAVYAALKPYLNGTPEALRG
jgi:2-dehydropantoate 2-reductase